MWIAAKGYWKLDEPTCKKVNRMVARRAFFFFFLLFFPKGWGSIFLIYNKDLSLDPNGHVLPLQDLYCQYPPMSIRDNNSEQRSWYGWRYRAGKVCLSYICIFRCRGIQAATMEIRVTVILISNQLQLIKSLWAFWLLFAKSGSVNL